MTLPRFSATTAVATFAAALAMAPAHVDSSQRPLVFPLTDAYGHVAHLGPSAECAASFLDIAATGAVLALTPSGAAPATDDGGAVLSLAAPFRLYGQQVTHLVVSTNGYLAAADSLARDSGGDYSDDCPLPAVPHPGPAVAGRILVLHDDLDGGASGGLLLHQHFAECPRPSQALANEPCTVIQWDSWSTRAGGALFDAQAVLYHGSSSVVVQHRGTPPSQATVGLQDHGARIALAPTCAGLALAPGTAALCFYEPRFPVGGPVADLELEIGKAPVTVVAGGSLELLVPAANAGPSPAVGAAVSSILDSGLSCTWTCEAGDGASCTPGPVAGPIADAVSLEPGGWAIYTVSCTVDPQASGFLVLEVGIETPPDTTDPNPADNSDAVVIVVLESALFADGFESGDTGAWSTAVQ